MSKYVSSHGWLTSWFKQNLKSTKRPKHTRLKLERLEEYVVPAPIAATSLNPPTTALIGEQATFTVSFDNASTNSADVGYGPYIDLYLPATGKDGNDGITYSSATYLGQSVNATVLTLTAAGVNHPFAKDSSGNPIVITPPAGFKAGDQLVVFELPFGSFTPAQPPIDLNVTVNLSNLADLDKPLPIRSQGGFRFGADPLDNPTSDPTIIGSASTGSITPKLFTLRKEYIGPEDETATGPNYVRNYRIVADIANGQTVKNLNLTDVLSNKLQYVSVDSVTGNNTILVTPVATPSTTTPGGTLTRRLDLVTGTASTSDAVMVFSFYAPLESAAAGTPEILNPTTGLPTTAIDDAKASGSWDPVDPRDPTVTVVSDDTTNDHTLTLKSIATQKTSVLVNDTGAPGYTPGDTLEYSLNVQISDYFAFNNLILTDTLGDGLEFDASFIPTLNVSEHGVNTSTLFAPANYTVAAGSPDDTLTFRVSDQLVTSGQDANLVGGNIPDGGTGVGNPPQSAPPLYSPGTTAVIKFRAVIKDTYEQTQASGVNTVTPNDTLGNDLTVSGNILNREDLTPRPLVPPVTDDSQADVQIIGQTAVKSVYAVNGNTNIGSPIQIGPGDTVTYRLQVQLPTTSATNFTVTDYLPLPLFQAAELTTLSLTTPSATPPPAGAATLGPNDTFYAVYETIGVPPAIGAVDASLNKASIEFGTFNDPNNTPTTLDILFTVTATNDPKADFLKLTNQILSEDVNRDNETSTDNTIVQVITAEPNVPDAGIQKGVVATNNPNAVFTPTVVGPVSFSPPGSPGTRFTGTITSSAALATPIDSNLRGVDAGDFVTFAVGVGNAGTGPNGAFDVRIRDTLPAGFRIPASGLNMTVTDGTGASMPFIDLGTGANAGLFGAGIELVDPGPTAIPTGALDPGRDLQGNLIDDGRNLVLITYDLEVIGTITPNTTITNTASIFSYADSEGGPNFLSAPKTNDAKVVTTTPTVTKRLVGTEINNTNNANDEAVIGELVTYEIEITIPEGVTPGVVVTDTLDSGLAFVRLNSVTASSDITGEDLTRSVTNNGRTLTANIGRIVNSNRDNSQTETIVVRYTAVVLNVLSNQDGTLLSNNARLTYTGGTPVTARAPELTVIEPFIEVVKDVQVDGSGNVGEAGSTVEYRITLVNTGTVDAWDVTFSDPLPKTAAGQTYIGNPVLAGVVDNSGIVTSANFEIVGSAATGYTVRTRANGAFDFPVDPTRRITLRITGVLTTAVQPAQTIRNTATVRWTSLDGNPGRRSTFNPNSTERTGSGVGPNDYIDSGNADISIFGEITKTLEATSDPFTEDNNVAVGEIVRYRLTGNFPQGSLPAVNVIDLLPAGMQFLNDGTTKIAFVSNGAGFSVDPSIFPAGSDAFVTGNQTTPVKPTFVLPASQISGGSGSGGDVTFNIGDIVNNDLDSDSELIIIEFNALVLNEAGNQAGALLANSFYATSDGVPQSDPSAPLVVRVVEPKLTIEKSVQPTTGDAGDTVSFTVLVRNSGVDGVSVAHDVRIFDVLPSPEYELVPGSVSVSRAVGFTDNSAGNTVDVTLDALQPGASVTVQYLARLTVAISPNQSIINQATTTYTSLPGENGDIVNVTGSVTPGASGSPTGERNGSGGINKYQAFDTALVQTPDLSLNKIVTGSSFNETKFDQHNPAIIDLAIGEEVTFRVKFTLPEITTFANLVDDLPISPGILEALSGRVISIGSNITGSLLAPGSLGVLSDRSGDGLNDRVSFNFGTLVNTPDNVTDDRDEIVVEITARVADVPQNVDGLVLVNTATLNYGNGGILEDTAEVEVVEPELNITKDITNTIPVDAGGVVDYEARVTHTAASTQDAVNVVIEDLLSDPLLTLVSGSVVVTSSTGSTVVELSPDGFQVAIPSIPLGEVVIIRYQAAVAATATPGQILPNTVDVNYNGTPPDPSVRPKDDDATANFVVEGASLSGFVYHEIRPGNTPIPGTTLRLIGVDIAGQPVSRTTTTGATGAYLFANVTPGTYQIVEDQPAGFISSRQEVGSPFGQPSPTVDRLNVLIPAGSADIGTNFNFFEVQPSSLSGYVYDDLANNGARDPIDPGIQDVIVRLTGLDWNGNAVSQIVRTNLLGQYSFADLLPGDYTIDETQPAGYLDNQDTIGSLGGSNPVSDRFVITSLGQNLTGVDYNFGELLPSGISGFVYLDKNNNGQKNRGEPGISGVRIILTGIDDQGNDVRIETRTNATGAYNFLNLRPGTYAVREIQPIQFNDGKDTLGSLLGTKSNDFFQDIVLDPNTFGIDYLFGELPKPGSKGGLLAR